MAKKKKHYHPDNFIPQMLVMLDAMELSRAHTRELAKHQKKMMKTISKMIAKMENTKACKHKAKKKKSKKKSKKIDAFSQILATNVEIEETDVEIEENEDINGLKDILVRPRNGGADDLKLISGVGPKLEMTLNELGVYHFDQIAQWSQPEIDWVDEYLNFPGRILWDNWIGQAEALAKGGRDEYVKVFGKEPR